MGNKKHFYDTDYFNVIDCEDKAYFLGLLYADGYSIDHISTEGFGITLQKQDNDILLKLKECIKSDYPIIEIPGVGNNKDKSMFYVYGKGIKEKLDKVGLFQRKTFKITFPNFLQENLMHHFIRGYFDGDGCIWNGKRKIMTVKDKACKNGFRDRIVHNVKFNITSNTSFITELQYYLNDKIQLPITKLYFRNKDNLNCATVEYSGRGNIKKFYNYIYDDATIYLTRKKIKFEEILNKNEV